MARICDGRNGCASFFRCTGRPVRSSCFQILAFGPKISCNSAVTKNTPASSNPSFFRASTLLWIAAFACLAAVGVHAYLLMEHYDLRYGQAAATSLCNINATFNCAAVSVSRYSEVLGYPVALLGAAANAALLLLLAWYAIAESDSTPTARNSVLILGTAIAIASIVMGSISSFILGKYCPFCMLAYVLSFITAAALWMALRKRPTGIAGRGITVPLIIGVLTFFGMTVANDQIRKSYNSDDLSRFAKEKIQEWRTAPETPFESIEPLVEGAPKETAKMTIVEFADFRCSHCKHAAPVLHAFVNAHPDVRLEFMTWPLDGECNTAISQANGASCLLAKAVYCGQKSGGDGWKAHSYVFEHQEEMGSLDLVKSQLNAIAGAAGVPNEAFNQCVNAPETKAAIEKQAAVGTALQLGGTPSVYVNGKKLEGGQLMPVLTEAYRALQAN